MDVPVQVPVDNPDADTEWNDILRKHGIIPEKPPSPTPMIQEALAEARREAHERRLEDKTLDELDELEDDEDEEFLQKYRFQRMAELASLAQKSVFNQVYPLQKAEYEREVTEASNSAFVLVHLASGSATNLESQRLSELWRQLARRFGEIKFCEIRADLCIEKYPETNTPTILIYKDGDIRRQLITLRELRREFTTIADLEAVLVSVGAVPATDHRLVPSGPGDGDTAARQAGTSRPKAGNDSGDDDWD